MSIYAATDHKLDQLNLYQRGNGQAGVIKDLRDADDKLNDRIDGIVLRISRWTGISIGTWTMLTMVMSALEAVRHGRLW